MNPLIELKNVTYTYPLSEHPAITNVSVNFEKGKFYGIIGENTAGKTTLCNVIRGLCPNFYKGELSGKVLWEGKDISEIPESDLSSQIGFVFQNPFIQISGVRETVFEEVGIGLENLGVPRDILMERVIQVCDFLHIGDLIEKNPMELSGGQCQRVAFAAIIAMDFDIMVIDEPTSQLDPEGTRDVFRIIELLKNEGKTIILVEHKIDLIAQYCDEIIVMKEGDVLLKGLTAEVLSSEKILTSGAPYSAAVHFGHSFQKSGGHLRKIPITNNQAKGEIMYYWEHKGGGKRHGN